MIGEWVCVPDEHMTNSSSGAGRSLMANSSWTNYSCAFAANCTTSYFPRGSGIQQQKPPDLIAAFCRRRGLLERLGSEFQTMDSRCFPAYTVWELLVEWFCVNASFCAIRRSKRSLAALTWSNTACPAAFGSRCSKARIIFSCSAMTVS
jgi:hypothetical protein